MPDQTIPAGSPAVIPQQVVPFGFDGKQVRVVVRDGEPWFAGVDVCAALGIVDSSQALSRLDDDEKGGGIQYPTLGGEQTLASVNEAGLYTLALRSRGAMTFGTVAHRFRKWVTGEVLPAIRKTGEYQTTKLREELAAAQARILLLEVARPLDKSIDDAAATLGIDSRDLFWLLMDEKWVYRRSNGISLLARSGAVDRGLMVNHAVEVNRWERSGTARWVIQGWVSPLGMVELARLLRDRAVEQAKAIEARMAWERDRCA